ncbi:hypothetical protein E4T47_03559 [Aureobasidium subglaciale]|nr:hypothetical protein E4T47_03559 [Aureobasidium subglaciale]
MPRLPLSPCFTHVLAIFSHLSLPFLVHTPGCDLLRDLKHFLKPPYPVGRNILPSLFHDYMPSLAPKRTYMLPKWRECDILDSLTSPKCLKREIIGTSTHDQDCFRFST